MSSISVKSLTGAKFVSERLVIDVVLLETIVLYVWVMVEIDIYLYQT